MSTYFDDIEEKIFKKLSDNWSATSISWPNVNLDVTSLSAWVEPYILWVDRFQQTITGDNSGQRIKGILHINIYVKPNKGTGLTKEYMDTLTDIFNHAEVVLSGSNIINFDVPKPSGGGIKDGEWWKESFKVEFNYLT